MAIDPLLYQKLSGRSGDPYTRLGEALAQDAKKQQQRDELPKGVSGGLKVTRMPGVWMNFLHLFKVWGRK
ncbi:MAG: hypothetical protein RBS39_09105 [Phycisphaerales bacterium]|jgi:hypothetical protein|nr:hypothetical protein [Phycisphaerales bacterium]